jgi:hypothetical protein
MSCIENAVFAFFKTLLSNLTAWSLRTFCIHISSQKLYRHWGAPIVTFEEKQNKPQNVLSQRLLNSDKSGTAQYFLPFLAGNFFCQSYFATLKSLYVHLIE